MVQGFFSEFNENTGVGDLLFVNVSQPNKYRFYRRRKSWDECYMVEFYSDSNDYLWYWGHNDDERGIIDLTFIFLPSFPIIWKRVDFNHYIPFNLTSIIESIEKDLTGQK